MYRMAGTQGVRLGTAPLGNSWIISIMWLYIALNRTPNIDCYWVGAVPKFEVFGILELTLGVWV